MIYLDSSALLKLVHDEAESEALSNWLRAQDAEFVVSSDLARVEVVRSTHRIDREKLAEASRVLESIDLIPIGGRVIGEARAIESPFLRSLDAIHLATALQAKVMISAFVTYNVRLREAASTAGLAVVAPTPDESRPGS